MASWQLGIKESSEQLISAVFDGDIRDDGVFTLSGYLNSSADDVC